MLEAGVASSIVATIMGSSPATTVGMAKRYGHIGQAARCEAIQKLNGVDFHFTGRPAGAGEGVNGSVLICLFVMEAGLTDHIWAFSRLTPASAA